MTQVERLKALLAESLDWKPRKFDPIVYGEGAIPHTSACIGGISERDTGERPCLRCRIETALRGPEK